MRFSVLMLRFRATLRHLWYDQFGGVGVVTRNPTPNPRGMDAWGHYAICPFSYVGPNPYLTGGDPVTAQQFKLGVLEYLDMGPAINAGNTACVLMGLNPGTMKIQAFWQNPTDGANEALKEVDNNTDLSGFTAVGIAFGKG